MNKQVLIKLAQVRMAINHVLRQRGLIKQAILERPWNMSNQSSNSLPSQPKPQPVPAWNFNPLKNGNEFKVNNQWFSNENDAMNHLNNPQMYPTREGLASDLYLYNPPSPAEEARRRRIESDLIRKATLSLPSK